MSEFKAEFEEGGNPRYSLIEIVDMINRRLRTIRNQIKVQKGAESRGNKVTRREDAEGIATTAIDLIKLDGQNGSWEVTFLPLRHGSLALPRGNMQDFRALHSSGGLRFAGYSVREVRIRCSADRVDL